MKEEIELRDLYNEKKEVTGKTIEKGAVIPNGYYISVVLTMIRNSKGEFLIQKRSERKNGLFAATGGHPKKGETPLEGAITEVKEEIGIDVKKEDMRHLFGHRFDEVFFDLYYTEKDLDIDEFVVDKNEVDYVEWMDIHRIDKLIKDGQFMKNHAEEFYRTLDILNIKL